MEPVTAPERDRFILAALRQAVVPPGEYRLFRVGKLVGLFPFKTGDSADAARFALETGLLDSCRREIRPKGEVVWVRLTPAGRDWLFERDSPRALLDEMRDLIGSAREATPRWLDGFLSRLEAIGTEFTGQMTEYFARLDAMKTRLDEALRRQEAAESRVAGVGPIAAETPWLVDALRYLDRRRLQSPGAPTPMPELFAAVARVEPEITLSEFHGGLSRLAGRHAVDLVAWDAGTPAPERPEFTLLDAGRMYYHVRRAA